MESLLGMRVGQIPALASILHAWVAESESALDLVAGAEILSGLTVPVAQPLLEIGADGRTMALAIEEAMAQILGHKLTITTEINPLLLARFAQPGEKNGTGGDSRGVKDHMRSEFFREINGAQPLGVGRVDELIELIRADTAAGRDPADHFAELNPLLDTVIGDSSPAAGASAMTMLMNGLGASQLRLLFSSGHNAAFAQIAFAMANGLSPSQAGVPAVVFPAEYVEWHDIDAERQRMQATIEQSWALNGLFRWGGGVTAQSRVELEQRLDRLHPNDPMRSILAQMLDGGFNFRLATPQDQAVVARYFRRSNNNLQAAFDAQTFEVQLASILVPTLDGDVHIEPDGSMSAFDAIGAAAATVPQVPVSFLGSAYAESDGEFEFHQVMQAVDRVSSDENIATSFLETLGAGQVMHFVNRYAWDAAQTTEDRFNPARNPLVFKLSIALGRASEHLDVGYATTLIETRSSSGSLPISQVVPPEWLFAYGKFEPGFLVGGAAASVGLHGGSNARGITRYELNATSFHPSILMINQVVRAQLGAEFVRELHRIDAVDALVWADPPIDQPLSYPLSDEPWPEGSIPLVSHVLVQAGEDHAASMSLIESAGSRTGRLQLDIANGISHVLAGQLPRFTTANEMLFLDTAENVYASGAGVELSVASRQMIVDTMVDGLVGGDYLWYTRNHTAAEFAGRIDGRRFEVFNADAQLRDQAIENAEKWIGAVANTVSIGIGLLGAVPTGGTSLAWTGVGVTGGGWLAPALLDPADNVEDFYRQEYRDLLNVQTTSGAALTLIALALSGRLRVPKGSFHAVETNAGLVLRLEQDGQVDQSWSVAVSDSTWAAEVEEALEAVQAEIQVDSESRTSVSGAVGTVGANAFVIPYLEAFAEETQAVHNS